MESKRVLLPLPIWSNFTKPDHRSSIFQNHPDNLSDLHVPKTHPQNSLNAHVGVFDPKDPQSPLELLMEEIKLSPVEVGSLIPLFTVFDTSQVDFFHQYLTKKYKKWANMKHFCVIRRDYLWVDIPGWFL